MPTFTTVVLFSIPVFAVTLFMACMFNSVKRERTLNTLLKDVQDEEKALKKLTKKQSKTAKTVADEDYFSDPAEQEIVTEAKGKKKGNKSLYAPAQKTKHQEPPSEFDEGREACGHTDDELDAFASSLAH